MKCVLSEDEGGSPMPCHELARRRPRLRCRPAVTVSAARQRGRDKAWTKSDVTKGVTEDQRGNPAFQLEGGWIRGPMD